ncbi:hypothetical protein QFZ79_003417 [Arthrobacter sp. V4I6]|uniref:hypothetical protein n=1 Tax=unclassified Arthrobacter TaxID=235627 RepID=UPI0027828E04|nr:MULTISPECIES: hypothetical protein [unclassified Arthrobacter]MDQ0821045.1 hypothetical protein [Arthrobacter sp. V1I7]MDQ0855306.1 hypothetical protein [Arthrobacter sp. V4I6]
MPWWSWIVIWIALVALSLLFFAVLGVRLFRQFMTTVKELGEAGDRFSQLPSTAPSPIPAEPGAVPGSAVFTPPARIRHEYHAAKSARQEARRLRRIQRKTDRGQPQRLHDIEFS